MFSGLYMFIQPTLRSEMIILLVTTQIRISAPFSPTRNRIPGKTFKQEKHFEFFYQTTIKKINLDSKGFYAKTYGD